MPRGLRRVLAPLITLFLLGGAALAQSTLQVTVQTAAQRPIPADARLVVELLDVSRAGAPSVRLAGGEAVVQRLPVRMDLPYDPARIDPRMSYVVAARLVSGREVLLRTTSAFPVLTRGAGQAVTVELEQTAAAPATGSGTLGAGISGTWTVGEIGGRALIADAPPTLTFDQDGGFSMFGGCNRFHGKAEMGEGRLGFPPAYAGTRRMCPPERMKLEDDMVAALKAVTGYARNGDRLVLTSASGLAVLRLSAEK